MPAQPSVTCAPVMLNLILRLLGMGFISWIADLRRGVLSVKRISEADIPYRKHLLPCCIILLLRFRFPVITPQTCSSFFIDHLCILRCAGAEAQGTILLLATIVRVLCAVVFWFVKCCDRNLRVIVLLEVDPQFLPA